MIARLAAAARELESVAARPVAEVEAMLSGVAEALTALPAFARNCPAADRDRLQRQVLLLRESVGKLDRVMKRSAAMFRGYASRAGSSCEEYTPGGSVGASRDPAFLSLRF